MKRIVDEYEPEQLAGRGEVVEAGLPVPNPSHPVRARVRPATWRRVGAERVVLPKYCVCGMLLPEIVLPKRSYCGRPTERKAR